MFRYKQVIAVRKDLDMSPGKLAVQVAHASLSAAEDARVKNGEWYENWREEKQKKVVVGVPSAEDLGELREEAEVLNLPHDLVTDAGLTELSPGTSTALGVGPAPDGEVDKVTGDLSLLGE